MTMTYKGQTVATPVLRSPSDYTLAPTDGGSQIQNAGATGPVTFTLPPALAASGLEFEVANIANLQKLTIQAVGSDYFQAITWATGPGGTISQTTTSTNKAAYVKLQCFIDGVWHLVDNFGFYTP